MPARMTRRVEPSTELLMAAAPAVASVEAVVVSLLVMLASWLVLVMVATGAPLT